MSAIRVIPSQPARVSQEPQEQSRLSPLGRRVGGAVTHEGPQWEGSAEHTI